MFTALAQLRAVRTHEQEGKVEIVRFERSRAQAQSSLTVRKPTLDSVESGVADERPDTR